MIIIRGEITEQKDFVDVVQWLLKDFRYLDWLNAETDTPEILSDAVRFILQNYGSSPYDSYVGLKNMVDSAELIRITPGVDELEGLFIQIPAIIALSGPSLNKQLPYLKTMQDKAVIICADTALKVLEREGITPHFVCKKERFDNTTAAVEGKHKSVLVLCPVCNPDVFTRYEGRKVIAYRDYAHFNWMPFKKGFIRKPGTVGNMCFGLAELLGCSPIVLIGADHAFSGNQTHAQGAEEYIGKQQGHCRIKGYYGGLVDSKPEFADAVRIFALDSQRRKDVYNATEGGAYIEGTAHKKFKSINLPPWPVGAANAFDMIDYMLSDYDPPEVDWDALKKDTVKRLDKIIYQCERGLEGLCTMGAVVETDPYIWNMLIIHVIQPYHLVWMIDKGDLCEWFTVVRDATRMVREVMKDAMVYK